MSWALAGWLREDRPAVLGGRPLASRPLRVTEPSLPGWWRLLPEMVRIWRRRWLTNSGPVARELAAQLTSVLGASHVVTAANGTLALMAALRAAVGAGEVIVPALGFAATAHAVLAAGATPRFVDVDRQSWLLTPKGVAAAVRSGTKGILAVHLYGQRCDRLGLEEVARRHQLPLLFDAAHAFGSRYADGRPVGLGGVAEVFSFHATKILTCGEGGAVTTDSADLAQKCARLLCFGDPGDGQAREPAWNGKLPELSALLALLALPAVPRWLVWRERLVARYRKGLAALPGLQWQAAVPGTRSNHQFLPLAIVDDQFGLTADQLVAGLAAEGIEARRYFAPPLHRLPAFESWAQEALPVAEELADSLVCLPIFSHMRLEQVDGVCRAVRRLHAWREAVAKRDGDE